MVIKNQIKNTILSESAVKAETFTQKTFGLILSKKPNSMIFQTRFGIHTFFMKYPIDVLVLNKENKVATLKNNLKPNRIFVWNIKHDNIIELPEGTIKKTATRIGDHILVNN
jgi:uncharacterized membrane protein (UPF0127 family)